MKRGTCLSSLPSGCRHRTPHRTRSAKALVRSRKAVAKLSTRVGASETGPNHEFATLARQTQILAHSVPAASTRLAQSTIAFYALSVAGGSG